MKKFYTIYKTTNQINGKIYIGKHETTKPADGYYGSGKAIKAAIKKYGKENFVKEVMHIFDTEEDMNQMEKELITEEFVARSDTYNAGVGGEGGPHFKGKTHTPETIAKFKKANEIRTPAQIEAAKKVGHASKGRKLSAQARENMSKSLKERGGPSKEHKRNISESLKKYWAEKRKLSV